MLDRAVCYIVLDDGRVVATRGYHSVARLPTHEVITIQRGIFDARGQLLADLKTLQDAGVDTDTLPLARMVRPGELSKTAVKYAYFLYERVIWTVVMNLLYKGIMRETLVYIPNLDVSVEVKTWNENGLTADVIKVADGLITGTFYAYNVVSTENSEPETLVRAPYKMVPLQTTTGTRFMVVAGTEWALPFDGEVIRVYGSHLGVLQGEVLTVDAMQQILKESGPLEEWPTSVTLSVAHAED